MTFTSLPFYAFLPIVFLVFYFMADRWRWLLLLLVSYGFYASFKAPYLLAVLLMVTCLSYVCGMRIAAQQVESVRRRWLWIGSFTCVAILALLKYFPYFELQTNSIFGLNSTLSSVIISIGASYFTFQAISYLADIYLDIEEPEKHFGYFALYLAFFPKLLQGPIERAGDLLPQLKKPYRFDYDTMRSGILLFSWGLFKKIVVADRLAQFVNPVYNDVHSYSGVAFIVVTYFYAIQLFCDFSGYTDMALGIARMFNVELTQNFKSPYFATSIADFWRRWHISFSRWILDYIFKPLQMEWRNWGQAGTALALLVTFLVSGIWHGASWGFVLWGLIHGIYLAASVYYKPVQKKIHKVLKVDNTSVLEVWKIVITFNLVCFAWIFFRSNTLDDSYYILSSMLKDVQYILDLKYVRLQFRGLGLQNTDLAMALFFISIIMIVNFIEYKKGDIWNKLLDQSVWVRWPVYYFLALSIIYFAPYNTAKNFIYMQF